jgi:hypothetical protein
VTLTLCAVSTKRSLVTRTTCSPGGRSRTKVPSLVELARTSPPGPLAVTLAPSTGLPFASRTRPRKVAAFAADAKRERRVTARMTADGRRSVMAGSAFVCVIETQSQ